MTRLSMSFLPPGGERPSKTIRITSKPATGGTRPLFSSKIENMMATRQYYRVSRVDNSINNKWKIDDSSSLNSTDEATVIAGNVSAEIIFRSRQRSTAIANVRDFFREIQGGPVRTGTLAFLENLYKYKGSKQRHRNRKEKFLEDSFDELFAESEQMAKELYKKALEAIPVLFECTEGELSQFNKQTLDGEVVPKPTDHTSVASSLTPEYSEGDVSPPQAGGSSRDGQGGDDNVVPDPPLAANASDDDASSVASQNRGGVAGLYQSVRGRISRHLENRRQGQRVNLSQAVENTVEAVDMGHVDEYTYETKATKGS